MCLIVKGHHARGLPVVIKKRKRHQRTTSCTPSNRSVKHFYQPEYFGSEQEFFPSGHGQRPSSESWAEGLTPQHAPGPELCFNASSPSSKEVEATAFCAHIPGELFQQLAAQVPHRRTGCNDAGRTYNPFQPVVEFAEFPGAMSHFFLEVFTVTPVFSP